MTGRSPFRLFFKGLFCELFPNRICELNLKDLGNVPYSLFYLFGFTFHASCFILKDLSLCRLFMSRAPLLCIPYFPLCPSVLFISAIHSPSELSPHVLVECNPEARTLLFATVSPHNVSRHFIWGSEMCCLNGAREIRTAHFVYFADLRSTPAVSHMTQPAERRRQH